MIRILTNHPLPIVGGPTQKALLELATIFQAADKIPLLREIKSLPIKSKFKNLPLPRVPGATIAQKESYHFRG